MAAVQRFEDLEVWQMARTSEHKVFAWGNAAGFQNDFDIIRQMRRSTGSIMDNIAEGFGRSSRLEFINSLSIAEGKPPNFNHNSIALLIEDIYPPKFTMAFIRKPKC